MPKVTAFTCGSRFGNCETFTKEALMALQRMGIETELIRLNDCDLRPCKCCNPKPCSQGGLTRCIYKDDAAWLAEKFYTADGVILAAPVWSLAPTSILSVFRDRIFGYKADTAMWERTGGAPEWAKGYKTSRPGALISVGGALTRHWTSLGLPTMYTAAFSNQTDVVDVMDVHAVSRPTDSVLRQDLILRARYLGENLGHAVLHPEKDWEDRYLGDETGEACPSCHTSLVLARPGNNYVECAVCGRRGYVTLENGGLQFTWPRDVQNRRTMMGKFEHVREIDRHGLMHTPEETEQAKKLLEKYRNWNDCVLTPPSRQKTESKSV